MSPVPMAPDSTPAFKGDDDEPRSGGRALPGAVAFAALAGLGAAALVAGGGWRT
jgi:hypothetical protein